MIMLFTCKSVNDLFIVNTDGIREAAKKFIFIVFIANWTSSWTYSICRKSVQLSGRLFIPSILFTHISAAIFSKNKKCKFKKTWWKNTTFFTYKMWSMQYIYYTYIMYCMSGFNKHFLEIFLYSNLTYTHRVSLRMFKDGYRYNFKDLFTN